MAFGSIPSAWLDIGDPTKKELFDLIKDNFDDLDSRINSVEAAVTNETPIQFSVIGRYYIETMPFLGAGTTIRIPFDIELTSAVLHVIDDGTAGTLDVDVKYKRGAAAFTTIFSTRPSLTFGSGNNSIATNGAISITDLDAGDFIRLDIITPQTNNEKFNLYLTWEIRA